MTSEPTARVDAMSQACAKSFDERRASPRQRRLNGAKIVFNNNSSVIDCIVRDLSPHGARLVVPALSAFRSGLICESIEMACAMPRKSLGGRTIRSA
jgi:hypothetical protein